VKIRLVALAAVIAAALLSCKPIQRLGNEIPTATVADTTVAGTVGNPAYLVGHGHDADGDDLSYLWYYADAPALSTDAPLYNYTSATAYVVPDVSGDYVFFFQVNDGIEDSKPVKVTVTVP
jgi:hypothetical protein